MTFFIRLLTTLLLTGSLTATAATLVEQRLQQEREAYQNSFVLIPHKTNYVLPLTYMHRTHKDINTTDNMDLQHVEMKFQLSLKVPVTRRTLLKDNGYLFFAYTNTSVWQAYNREESSPFRDSNHEPEMLMIFTTPVDWRGLTIPAITTGFSHQSNGQSGVQSRGWNRIYVSTTFSYNDWYLSVKPWWRIPQREKRNPDDAKGDDNPDILHYYGHFEINLFREFGNNHLSLMLRNNLKQTNRGAIEINYSYPLSDRIKGYVQLFHGYGEMMLDYSERNTRIGFGFLFNDWL